MGRIGRMEGGYGIFLTLAPIQTAARLSSGEIGYFYRSGRFRRCAVLPIRPADSPIGFLLHVYPRQQCSHMR